jgi:hypothetical protein
MRDGLCPTCGYPLGALGKHPPALCDVFERMTGEAYALWLRAQPDPLDLRAGTLEQTGFA